MSEELESFLARLYVDASLRERFLGSPRAVGEQEGLSAWEVRALERIDREGLRLAARSLELKQARRRLPSSRA
jgi:hypothetical protein